MQTPSLDRTTDTLPTAFEVEIAQDYSSRSDRVEAGSSHSGGLDNRKQNDEDDIDVIDYDAVADGESLDGPGVIDEPPRDQQPITGTSTMISRGTSTLSKSNSMPDGAPGVREISSEKTHGGALLLRLFQSEVFDSYLHMFYLFKRKEAGVHDYLVELLYRRPDEEIHFYLPQLVHLAITRTESSLSRFLLDKAARSMHLALKANWLSQATVEDKTERLSDCAGKLREDIEMAVVNSRPFAASSGAMEHYQGSHHAGGKTPDLFLRRRAVRYLMRTHKRKGGIHQARENRAIDILLRRFPHIGMDRKHLHPDDDVAGRGNYLEVPSPVREPGEGRNSLSSSYSAPAMSPLLTPMPSPSTAETPSPLGLQQQKAPRKKGRISPGFVCRTGQISVEGGKVKVNSAYVKLGPPFAYSSFSRESQGALLDDDEMQQFIIKQRRCDYFNLVGSFIASIIDVCDKLVLEPDKALRTPLVRSFLHSLDEWMLCRRCIVAASEGIFAMTGVAIPFTHFGIEPERNQSFGVPALFHAPFLVHPTSPAVSTVSDGGAFNARYGSAQMIRIVFEGCKVFSSKKRAPYLLVFELADLDEDLYDQNGSDIVVPAVPRRDRSPRLNRTRSRPCVDSAAIGSETPGRLEYVASEQNLALQRNASHSSFDLHRTSSRKSLKRLSSSRVGSAASDGGYESPAIAWDTLYVYRAIINELKQRQLYEAPFCCRPLTTEEIARMYDESTRNVSCKACNPGEPMKPETAGAIIPVENDQVFPFECPFCHGTKIFADCIDEDQVLYGLRRSLGIRGQTEPLAPPRVPVWKPGSDLRTPPGSARSRSPEQRRRRQSLLASIGLPVPSPGGSKKRSASSERHSSSISPRAESSDRRLRGFGNATDSGHRASLPFTAPTAHSGSGIPALASQSVGEPLPSSASAANLSAVAHSAGAQSMDVNQPASAFASAHPSAAAVPTNGSNGTSGYPWATNIRAASQSGGLPELYIEGESEGAQAYRIRRCIWGETFDEMRDRVRRSSPYGVLKSWRLGAVLVKGRDDVRQELLASQLICQFKAIFDEAKLGLYLRPYEILVTSSHSGIMEFVTDTQSIDAIKRKYQCDNLSKIFHAAFADNLPLAKKNFIESHAAYSLVGYLLQVKDRHNGNLLLDAEGHIIHIDYGFMLTNSPGFGYMNFETSPFKLSTEIMGILDGEGSDNFEFFKELIIKGFLEIRKHADRIFLVVEMMAQSSKMPAFSGAPDAAIAALKDRFMLGVPDSACMSRVHELIEQSVSNWRTLQYDNLQRLTNGIW